MNKTSSEADARFMRMALAQAESSVLKGQMPFGSVVVDRAGRIVAKGHNEVRSTKDPAAHGEVVAIRKAWRRLGEWQKLEGGTLYTNCEPCLLCSFVITQVGLGRVVYAARGTDVPTYRPLMGSDFRKAAAWVNSQPDWRHIEVVPDFMRGEAVKALDSFKWGEDYARKV